MKFLLVRHGETDWNRLGRFQGQYDTPLNLKGLVQAKTTAYAARDWGVTALYASPLSRTMQVADQFRRQLGLPVSPRNGLQEMDLGELEGIGGAEMRSKWPEIFNAWRDNPEALEMPGGESLAQLQERSWQVILELERVHSPTDILALISHNFAIRSIFAKLLGMPLSGFHRMTLNLSSVSAFESDSRGRRLLYYNSTGHLPSQLISHPG